VKRPGRAGDALTNNFRIFVDENAHVTGQDTADAAR
jgi:hypothetical protein